MLIYLFIYLFMFSFHRVYWLKKKKSTFWWFCYGFFALVCVDSVRLFLTNWAQSEWKDSLGSLTTCSISVGLKIEKQEQEQEQNKATG